MHNKIDTLLGILEDYESVEELQREIQSYHLKFEKDEQKLGEIAGEVTESGDEELVKLYFKVAEFLHEERKLFKEHVSRNEYDLYVRAYALAFERIFEDHKESKQNSKLEPSIDKKLSAEPNPKPKSGLPPPKPVPDKIKSEKSDIQQDSRQAEKENLKKKPSEVREPGREGRDRESRLRDNRNVIDSYFSKLEALSKSPHQGFGSIASNSCPT